MGGPGRHEGLVRVAGEVRDKGERLVAADQQAPAVRLLGGQDVLEQGPSMLRQVLRLRRGFDLDGLEHEVGGVDLAVRMGIAHADHLPLVLEHEHVPDVVARAELAILCLQRLEQVHDLLGGQPGEGEVVARRKADDTGTSAGGPVPIDSRWCRELRGCPGADARVVVVEHEDAGVTVVSPARAAHVTGTEVAILDVGRQRARGVASRHTLAQPGSLVAVGRHDHPLAPQRMPTLFPDHAR